MATATYKAIDLLTAVKQVGMLATQTTTASNAVQGVTPLNYIYLKTGPETTELSASCSAGSVVATIKQQSCDGEISVALDPRTFTHAVGSLIGEDTITLQTAGSTLKVKGSKSVFKLTSASQALPIQISDAEPKVAFTLDEAALSRIVRQVVPYVAPRSANRPHMENVGVRIDNERLIAGATNSVQLAAVEIDIEPDRQLEKPLSITVTPFAVKVMLALARQFGSLDVEVHDSFIKASGSSDDIQVQVALNLVAIVTPNIMRYLEMSDYKYSINVDTSELRRVLRTASGDLMVDTLYLYQRDGELYGIYESPANRFATKLDAEVKFHNGASDLKLAVAPKRLKMAVESCAAGTFTLSRTAQANLLHIDPDDGSYRGALTLIGTDGVDLDEKLRDLIEDDGGALVDDIDYEQEEYEYYLEGDEEDEYEDL